MHKNIIFKMMKNTKMRILTSHARAPQRAHTSFFLFNFKYSKWVCLMKKVEYPNWRL